MSSSIGENTILAVAKLWARHLETGARARAITTCAKYFERYEFDAVALVDVLDWTLGAIVAPAAEHSTGPALAAEDARGRHFHGCPRSRPR
ncbi:MAG TPA: hypothetical protein VEJ89_14640 [Myxococcaceae bacterium]|nr:hypothetical protein [Myxococcaceae bacterium]